MVCRGAVLLALALALAAAAAKINRIRRKGVGCPDTEKRCERVAAKGESEGGSSVDGVATTTTIHHRTGPPATP